MAAPELLDQADEQQVDDSSEEDGAAAAPGPTEFEVGLVSDEVDSAIDSMLANNEEEIDIEGLVALGLPGWKLQACFDRYLADVYPVRWARVLGDFDLGL